MTDKKRVNIDRKARQIYIRAYYEQQKQQLLTLWLVLWTIAGIGIISQFFFPTEDGLVIYLIVILSFWIYFEYKVLDAFRWRKYGEEVIVLDDENLSIENRIAGRGIAHSFEQSWIKNLRMVDRNDQSFWLAMNNSYWNVGQEGLTFEFKGRDIYFGRELNRDECGEVLKFLKDQLSSGTQ